MRPLHQWNATSWDEFSRKWNKPVHTFLLRHVYASSMSSYKLSRQSAMFFTFLLSAAVHELVMAIVTKKIRYVHLPFGGSNLVCVHMLTKRSSYYTGCTSSRCNSRRSRSSLSAACRLSRRISYSATSSFGWGSMPASRFSAWPTVPINSPLPIHNWLYNLHAYLHPSFFRDHLIFFLLVYDPMTTITYGSDLIASPDPPSNLIMYPATMELSIIIWKWQKHSLWRCASLHIKFHNVVLTGRVCLRWMHARAISTREGCG